MSRGGHDQRDRELLVDACLDLADALAEGALRDRVRAALTQVGVTEEVPLGEPFDPRRHVAVGRASIRHADGHNTIASVDRAGWVDRGRLRRLASVVVNRYEAEST